MIRQPRIKKISGPPDSHQESVIPIAAKVENLCAKIHFSFAINAVEYLVNQNCSNS